MAFIGSRAGVSRIRCRGAATLPACSLLWLAKKKYKKVVVVPDGFGLGVEPEWVVPGVAEPQPYQHVVYSGSQKKYKKVVVVPGGFGLGVEPEWVVPGVAECKLETTSKIIFVIRNDAKDYR